jgi:hypothetical protein
MLPQYLDVIHEIPCSVLFQTGGAVEDPIDWRQTDSEVNVRTASSGQLLADREELHL